MSISFSDVPKSRIPFIYVEFDNSKAQRYDFDLIYRVLIIGQKLDSGSAKEFDKPYPVKSAKEASDLFGAGSMLHLMVKAFLANASDSKLYAVALKEDDHATAQSWSITKSGEYKNPVEIPLFMGSDRRKVVLNDQQKDPLVALKALIDSAPDLPVTAVLNADKHELVLNAKNKGSVAGDFQIQVDPTYTGSISFQIADPVAGVGSVAIESLLTKVKDAQFHLIAMPYFDQLPSLETDLDERFSPRRQLEGHAVCALKGDLTPVTAAKKDRKSKHVTLLASGKNNPTSPYLWTAALTGVIAAYGQDDPAAPFKSCPIQGVIADSEENRFTRSEREEFLKNNVSTWYTQSSNTPRVELLITTYKNDENEADESYLYTNTLLVCMAIRHSFVNYFGAKYARAKLADDGAFLPSGVQMLTPKIGKSEAVNLFKAWVDNGWVSGLDEFKNSLIVERNQKDPTRLDFYLEPKFVSQLNIIGAKISFLF